MPLRTDLRLDTDHPDFAATGLHVGSTLRLHRLLTVPADIIRRELGRLSPSLQNEVANRLRFLFGLA